MHLGPGQLGPRDHLSDLIAVDVLYAGARNRRKSVAGDPVVRSERCSVAQGRRKDTNGHCDHPCDTHDIGQHLSWRRLRGLFSGRSPRMVVLLHTPAVSPARPHCYTPDQQGVMPPMQPMGGRCSSGDGPFVFSPSEVEGTFFPSEEGLWASLVRARTDFGVRRCESLGKG